MNDDEYFLTLVTSDINAKVYPEISHHVIEEGLTLLESLPLKDLVKLAEEKTMPQTIEELVFLLQSADGLCPPDAPIFDQPVESRRKKV